MRLLLDTGTFLWLTGQPAKLSAPAIAAINDPQNELFLSDTSVWEIVLKHTADKLPLPNRLESGCRSRPRSSNSSPSASLPKRSSRPLICRWFIATPSTACSPLRRWWTASSSSLPTRHSAPSGWIVCGEIPTGSPRFCPATLNQQPSTFQTSSARWLLIRFQAFRKETHEIKPNGRGARDSVERRQRDSEK